MQPAACEPAPLSARDTPPANDPPSLDRWLDAALEDSFPASDPVAVARRA